MGRSKRQRLEFRFYEIPQNEYVLALLGDSWRRVYGHDVQYLHFHNLMEIGIYGREIGEILNAALKMVIDEPEKNDREELLAFAAKQHRMNGGKS